MAAKHALATPQKSLTFCFDTWEPYSFVDQNGSASGLSIDLIRHAAQNLNITVNFKFLPWKRCLANVEKGDLDAVVDAGKRDHLLQGPTALTFYSNAIWVHRQDELTNLSSLDKLSGRRAGYTDGYTYDTIYMTIPQIKIDYSATEKIALRKLNAGRVDYAIADYVSTKHILKTIPLDIRALRPFPSVNPLYLSFDKNLTQEHHLFETMFKKMMADGTVDAHYQNYIGESLQDLISAF